MSSPSQAGGGSFSDDLGQSTQNPNQTTPKTVTTEEAQTIPAGSASASLQLPSPGNQLRFSADQLSKNPYEEYFIDSRYEEHTGRFQLGVASPQGFQGSDCVFAQIHKEYWTRVIQWTCTRIEEAPILPHWDFGNSNEVLLKKDILPASSVLTGDSRRVWRVSGVYIYGCKKAPGNSARRFYSGAPPFSIESAEIFVLQEGAFSREILKSVQ